VNFLLCSATDGNSRGLATKTMLSNCSTHFLSVLRILQPTVLVCQGKNFFHHVAGALGVSRKTESLLRYRLNGVDGVGVCLNHPSAPQWKLGWGHLEQPYLRKRVLPLPNELRGDFGLSPVDGNWPTA